MEAYDPSVSRNRKKPVKRRWPHHTLIFWIIVLAVVLVLGLLKHKAPTHETKPHPSIAVAIAKAQTATVPVYILALGTVTPIYTVTVRTQINGQLQQVLFKEGQLVKAGDLLAEIDPRPYQAQLVQYQGQLERDQALLTNAQLDMKRYQTLWQQNSVAKQVLDTQVSLVKQYEGNVATDQGLIQNTQLNISYCRITSLINGRIGLRLVDPGNYVQTSDTTGLAVITMLDPITIIFTIPEDDILAVQSSIFTHKKLTAEAYDREQNKLLAKGSVLTIDNQIDTTTGTVKLKAQFKNPNNRLFPNQFVNVKLLVNTLENVVTVPTAALQYSSKGPFVYLVDPKQTVHMALVKTGVTNGDNTVISTGLSVGQSVVTEGADKLTDGAKVSIAPTPAHHLTVAINQLRHLLL